MQGPRSWPTLPHPAPTSCKAPAQLAPTAPTRAESKRHGERRRGLAPQAAARSPQTVPCKPAGVGVDPPAEPRPRAAPPPPQGYGGAA